jgi:hypothetical protein
MVPLIGFMIGAYIITRMIEILLNKQTHGAVAACAAVTILVVLFCILSLLLSGNLPLQNIPGQ